MPEYSNKMAEVALRLLSETASKILRSQTIEFLYEDILSPLVSFLDVSRVYVFIFCNGEPGRLRSSQVAECVAEGIVPQIDNPRLQNFDMEAMGFTRWMQAFNRGETIVGDIRDFPSKERDVLETQDIKSILVVPIVSDGELFGFLGVDECRKERSWQDLTVFILRNIALLLGNAIERIKLRDSLNQSFWCVVNILSSLTERKDPYMAEHSARVAEISVKIGKRLGLSSFALEGLYIAGILHDIGKMLLPAEILSRPGKLTSQEIALLQTHPSEAFHILKDVQFPWPVAEFIYQHHEYLDGSGYPHGVKGEQIATEARILGVADVLEAIASHRPYRPARTIADARLFLKQSSGTLFDPRIVSIAIDLLDNQKILDPDSSNP